jgi:hypothetical protein
MRRTKVKLNLTGKNILTKTEKELVLDGGNYMRYVSEKRVRDYLSRYNAAVANSHKATNYYEGYTGAIEFLLTMMETLPDEKLRPMVDVPTNEYVLCLTEDTRVLERMIKRDYFDWMTNEGDDWYYPFDKLLGWIPMPKVVV